MVRILQVNILRSMVNVFTIQRKVCVKEISNLVEVQNKIKIKCFNIVSIVTDNVDDNGENKGVIEKELTKISKCKAVKGIWLISFKKDVISLQ